LNALVPSRRRGRMIPSELERLVQLALEKGGKPFFVCSTTGTTVFGAFDPITEVADICEKYNMWFHIDVREFVQLSQSYASVSIETTLIVIPDSDFITTGGMGWITTSLKKVSGTATHGHSQVKQS